MANTFTTLIFLAVGLFTINVPPVFAISLNSKASLGNMGKTSSLYSLKLKKSEYYSVDIGDKNVCQDNPSLPSCR